MKSLGSILLGLLALITGYRIHLNGTFGKYEQFPVPPITGWLVMGVGAAFLLYGIRNWLRNRKK